MIRPAGTRAQRTPGSEEALHESGGTARIRFELWRASDLLYRGELAWRVRFISWLVLGIPAWFVSPWLVLLAIVAAELTWIVALRWIWHRNRARRDSPS